MARDFSKWRSGPFRYAIAAAIVIAGLGVAHTFDSLLGAAAPFAAFYVATVVSTYLAGRGPGWLALTLGMVATDTFFVAPHFSFGVWEGGSLALAAFYILVSGTAIFAIDSHRKQRLRAEAALGEAKRAAAALAASEHERSQVAARLELALDAAGLGTWEVDLVKRTVTASSTTATMLAAEKPGPAAADWIACIHPDDRERVQAEFSAAIRGRRENEVEFRTVRPNGVRWVSARGRIVSDEQGHPVRLVGVAQDITVRKQAEEALRESEVRLKSLAENVPSVLIRYDRQFRVEYLSSKGAEITGIPVERFVGRTNREAGIPADLCILWENAIERVFRSGVDQDLEFDFPSPAGPRTFYLKLAPEFAADGSISHVLGVSTEITARKLAEQKIRDQNAVLEAINKVLSEALACDTEEELGRTCLNVAEALTQSKFGFVAELSEGRSLDDIAISDPGWSACRIGASKPRPEESESAADGRSAPEAFKIHGIYGRVILDRKGFFTNDPSSHPDRVGLPEGHPPIEAFLGAPLFHGGELVGMIAVANRPGGYRPQDLDALESLSAAIVQVIMHSRAERAVRESEERLREAQKRESIGLLAAGIAHDFNNLLTSVLGNASLLLEDLPSMQRPRVQAISAGAQKCADLTRQLLAYAGKGRFAIEDMDLSAAVRGIADLLRVSVPKTIELTLDVPHGLPLVRADAGQIHQIVMNLIINAAEAIGAGERGAVSVRTGTEIVSRTFTDAMRQEVAPGTYTYIEVTDTGSGMDEATKAKIFEPFFSTKFTGRGLGLAAVSGVVRGHSGALRLESSPGKGSRFRVLLPALPRVHMSRALKPDAARDLRGSGVVLVVDDEAIVLDFMHAVLKRYGYAVLTARDGNQGLAAFEERADDIDLIVLDLVMPVKSGGEILPEIKRRRPDLPVIVTSGYNSSEAVRLCAEGAASDFLQKPCTAQDLAAKVKALLGAVARP